MTRADRKSKAPQADALVTGGSSVYLLHILSEPAREWVRENVSRQGFQPNFPQSLVVEHRYVSVLVEGMQASGLVVR
jgi:hypothetical protein